MSAETGAVIAAVKCGAMVVGGVAVTLLCAYGLYKLYKKFLHEENPHDQRNGMTVIIVTTVDDLQAEVPQRSADPEKIRKLEGKIRRIEKKLRSSSLQDIEVDVQVTPIAFEDGEQ